MQKRASIVLLAAGMSRRASGNKLLYPISKGSVTAIEKAITTALESNVGPIIVVLGYEADKLALLLEKYLLAITITVNNQYTGGMSESVRTGVQKAFELHPANPVMVIPADCILITAEDIRKVAMAHSASINKIAVASYKGRNGHPIIFNQELIPELLAINEETYGLRAVINRHEVFQVETGNPGVLKDFDTDEDFQDYRKTS
ncbi:MAG: NTP transferase domain-containing protein [Candidatus Odinarchaeota archaeon]